VTHLGFIERGENVPTLTIILKLTDALDVSAGRPVGVAATCSRPKPPVG